VYRFGQCCFFGVLYCMCFSYSCHYERPTHCGGTTSCGACVMWVVRGYAVGGTLVTMHNKYSTIHNTDTVAYATQW